MGVDWGRAEEEELAAWKCALLGAACAGVPMGADGVICEVDNAATCACNENEKRNTKIDVMM